MFESLLTGDRLCCWEPLCAALETPCGAALYDEYKTRGHHIAVLAHTGQVVDEHDKASTITGFLPSVSLCMLQQHLNMC